MFQCFNSKEQNNIKIIFQVWLKKKNTNFEIVMYQKLFYISTSCKSIKIMQYALTFI